MINIIKALEKVASAITDANARQGAATKTYSSNHTAWTLSAAEQQALLISAGGTADAGFDIIFPTIPQMWIVKNATGQTATCKIGGQTGVTVANAKTTIVYFNGTDIAAATAAL